MIDGQGSLFPLRGRLKRREGRNKAIVSSPWFVVTVVGMVGRRDKSCLPSDGAWGLGM